MRMHRRKSILPPLIRSFSMQVWLRLLWFIFIVSTLIQSSYAGVIVTVIDVNLKVTARSDVVVEIPYNIGWLTFKNNESFPEGNLVGVAYMETGPVYDFDSGLPISTISIQTANLGYIYPAALWLGVTTPIGKRQEANSVGLLWGDDRPLPTGIDGDGDPTNEEPFIIVPWQFSTNYNASIIWGTGWVTLSNIDRQMSPMTPTGIDYLQSPAYIVRQVVLASEEISLQAGVIPPEWYNGGGGGSNGGGTGGSGGGLAPVPEPSTYLILFTIIFYIINKRSPNG